MYCGGIVVWLCLCLCAASFYPLLGDICFVDHPSVFIFVFQPGLLRDDPPYQHNSRYLRPFGGFFLVRGTVRQECQPGSDDWVHRQLENFGTDFRGSP